ncbi:microsomal glutathione S-transferase 1-like isoform X1 [Tenebrio molitor]|uniref:microsomal glutathione S-transferase 1-like isoform X1 n=1 Tax=Tenebrio molitor TaxID=7067 RepID=UPI0036249348
MGPNMEEIVNFSNPVFRNYLYNSSVLVAKVLALSFYTVFERFRLMAFANPEDGATMKIKPRVDDKVERIRRAHLNDLENISVFYVIGFIYTLTNPSVAWATLLFRVFTAARFIHTFVYAVFVVPQPARALSWATGFLITGYMAFKSIMHFL